jgi:hypothetical protein
MVLTLLVASNGRAVPSWRVAVSWRRLAPQAGVELLKAAAETPGAGKTRMAWSSKSKSDDRWQKQNNLSILMNKQLKRLNSVRIRFRVEVQKVIDPRK